jgi:putative membrane protein
VPTASRSPQPPPPAARRSLPAVVNLVLRFAGNVAAIWVASQLVDGVSYSSDAGTLLLAALVLTVANAIVKPIVTILSLPLIILTLGIALFFVSLAMLALTAALVDGFDLGGFWPAVAATFIVWVVNLCFSALTRDFQRDRSR